MKPIRQYQREAKEVAEKRLLRGVYIYSKHVAGQSYRSIGKDLGLSGQYCKQLSARFLYQINEYNASIKVPNCE